MTTAKTKTKLWLPIHELTYTSGERVWQVGCQVNGDRMQEASARRVVELNSAVGIWLAA